MLPKLKKRMKSSGIGIIILNENSFHMSFYGYINHRVFFTKGLQGLSPAVFVVGGSFGSVENNGYSVFDDHTLPDAEVDSTFSWYQRSQQHACQNDECIRCRLQEEMCFSRSKYCSCKITKAVAESTSNQCGLGSCIEGSTYERVAELVIEMGEIKAEKITLETQTVEQPVAANALKQRRA